MLSGRTSKSFKKQLSSLSSKFRLCFLDYFFCCCISKNAVSEEEIIPCLDLNKNHESEISNVSESCAQTASFLPMIPVSEPKIAHEQSNERTSDDSIINSVAFVNDMIQNEMKTLCLQLLVALYPYLRPRRFSSTCRRQKTSKKMQQTRYGMP
uniref:Uncharacterized protein n=1 Tax=Octopus bimaculoides TaxID=37653 RepID=A0A0L8H8A8_OCTBM